MLFTVILLLLVAGVVGLWLRSQQRQYALNRQLIAALVKGDDKQAFALVNEGADPNTRYTPTPVPSLLQQARQLLHRSASPVNNSPTALLIACGAPFDFSSSVPASLQYNRPDAPQLVRAMLRHRANVSVPDSIGWMPLMWAVCAKRRDTVSVLLAYGANVNTTDDDGSTVLEAAASDNSFHIVRLLLEHGANPNVAGAKGHTPLMDAQLWHNPDLIALLKHYGAKK
jgi:hypothetical protein